MARVTITITAEDDGSFTVDVQESATVQAGEQGEAPEQPQTVKSVDEVLQIVQQELAGEPDTGQQWQQEAAGRDAQGYRQAGGPMQPIM